MSKPRAGSAPAGDRDAGARKRSASPSMLRRIAAATTALVLGAGLALVAVAAPASAHTAKVSGDASCESDGTYTVVWTIDASNVPDGKTATVKVVEPAEFAGVELPPVSGDGTTTWTQHGVVDDGGAASVAFSIAWPDYGPKELRGSVKLTESCSGAEAIKKIPFCHATDSETNPYVRIETSVNAFLNAGHLHHQDGRDIYPAFTIVKKKLTIDVPAQGDQSLLQYEDCELPGTAVDIPAEPDAVELEMPAKPEPHDVCGVVDDRILPPAAIEGVEWTISPVVDGSATATASVKPGFTFPNGKTSESWSYTFDDEPCAEPTSADTPAAGPTGSGGEGSTPAVAGAALASTGFAGTTIGIVAGIVVAAGIAFLVIARVRRKRS
jgi:hypothetical protein